MTVPYAKRTPNSDYATNTCPASLILYFKGCPNCTPAGAKPLECGELSPLSHVAERRRGRQTVRRCRFAPPPHAKQQQQQQNGRSNGIATRYNKAARARRTPNYGSAVQGGLTAALSGFNWARSIPIQITQQIPARQPLFYILRADPNCPAARGATASPYGSCIHYSPSVTGASPQIFQLSPM